MEDWQPQIIAFCCRHCAYAAADLAGGLRLTYPPAIKIVEVPCTGRVDMSHILRGFEDGADGVLVAGCLPGECHYLEGNLRAQQRVAWTRALLEEIGLQGERLAMVNLSSVMGVRLAEIATQMTERIKALGPNPLRTRGL